MKRPNFFIVGAPKCATTAVYSYLDQHPEVFLAPKEITYFGSDLPKGFYPRPNLTEYIAAFSGSDDYRLVGDVAVMYLASTEAAREIHAFAPAAKIIIMLRQPVEMMYAYYYQQVWNGVEDAPSFRDALDLEEERRRGSQVPEAAEFSLSVCYRYMADFGPQIARFLDHFRRGQVHFFIYEDFRDDPSRELSKLYRFLGIDPGFGVEPKRINASKHPRSRWLANKLARPPAWIRSIARAFLPQRFRREIFSRMRKANTRYQERPPMDEELRRQLQEEFRPRILQVQELTGRDLSRWLKV